MPNEQKTYQFGNYILTKSQIHAFLDKYTSFLCEQEEQAKKAIADSKQVLKEIPALISWVDNKIASPNQEFEIRLNNFAMRYLRNGQ